MVFRIFNNARFQLYCWLFCVVIVLIVACFLSWLSLTPKNPRFHISDTHLLPLNTTTAKNFMFNLEILNPNKRMGIFYGGITLSLYDGDCNNCVVGTNSSIPSFYQGYRNTTSLHILIHATRPGSKASGGYVVGVQTYVRFRIIKWKTKLRRIEFKSINLHVPEYSDAGEVQAPVPAAVEIKAASSNFTF